MKLVDLEPQLLRYEKTADGTVLWHHVASIAEADGIRFLCPLCFEKNKGKVGTHAVVCWTPKAPPEATPGPGRWNIIGTSFADISLVAPSSSIRLTAGCMWHGYVTNGEAQ